MDRQDLDSKLKNNIICIQSKNLLMHWDLEKNDPIYIRHKKHLKECSACQKAHKKLEQKEVQLKLEIPMPVMALDAKESFINETNEIFKRLELTRDSKREDSKIGRLNENLAILYKILFSKSMIPVYGLSIFTYLLLAKYI